MSTAPALPPTNDSIIALAARHGLKVRDEIVVENVGLDFLVAFATANDGERWVLRIPRRADVIDRARHEARVLQTIRPQLPVAVPDWRIHSAELIAYPRLAGTPAITMDPTSMQPIWHLDRDNPQFVETLGAFLSALHGIAHETIAAAGLSVRDIDEVRAARVDVLDRVQRELGIGEDLSQRWRKWLDDDRSWPSQAVMTHGDLYVAHTLIDEHSRVVGVLDWSEAAINDPTIDFIHHLAGFGEAGLDQLIAAYDRHGGRTWPNMRQHVQERQASFPLDYALYALTTQNPEHLSSARMQLGA